MLFVAFGVVILSSKASWFCITHFIYYFCSAEFFKQALAVGLFYSVYMCIYIHNAHLCVCVTALNERSIAVGLQVLDLVSF